MHSSILLASLALTTAVTSPDLSRINEYPEVALGPLPTDLSVRDDYAGEGACNTDVCLQTWIQSPKAGGNALRIFATTFRVADPENTRRVQAIDISTGLFHIFPSRAVWTGSRFLVFWRGASGVLMEARFAADGAFLGTITMPARIEAPAYEEKALFKVLLRGQDVVAAWAESNSIKVRVMDLLGDPRSKTVATSPAASAVSVEAIEYLNEMLLVAYNTRNELMLLPIDIANGNQSRTPALVGGAASTADFSVSNKGQLIVWDEQMLARLKSRRIDSQGQPMGDETAWEQHNMIRPYSSLVIDGADGVLVGNTRTNIYAQSFNIERGLWSTPFVGNSKPGGVAPGGSALWGGSYLAWAAANPISLNDVCVQKIFVTIEAQPPAPPCLPISVLPKISTSVAVDFIGETPLIRWATEKAGGAPGPLEYGLRLDTKGSVIDKAALDLPMGNAVAGTDSFAFFHRSAPPGQDVMRVRILRKEGPLGEPVDLGVSGGTAPTIGPFADVAKTQNGFVAFWTTGGSVSHLTGRFFSGDGAKGVAIAPFGKEAPLKYIAAGSRPNELVAVWVKVVNPDPQKFGYGAAYFDGGGTLVHESVYSSKDPDVPVCPSAPSIVAAKDGFLMVCETAPFEGWSVVALRKGQPPKLLGTIKVPNPKGTPVISRNQDSLTMLVSTSEGPRGARLLGGPTADLSSLDANTTNLFIPIVDAKNPALLAQDDSHALLAYLRSDSSEIASPFFRFIDPSSLPPPPSADAGVVPGNDAGVSPSGTDANVGGATGQGKADGAAAGGGQTEEDNQDPDQNDPTNDTATSAGCSCHLGRTPTSNRFMGVPAIAACLWLARRRSRRRCI